MSKILYLDCPTGIAGDMFLAALADAGADMQQIEEQLRQLDLAEWQMDWQKVKKQGIAALQLQINYQPQHHHRQYRDILQLLEGVSWDQSAIALSHSIFAALAQAEAEVHGCSMDEVHFHETGAIDSIIDICGAALAISQLQISRVYCSALPLSSGYVDCEHGRLPLPAPATALLLRGKKLLSSPIEGETITPTGAAILVGSGATQDLPPFMLQAIGHGAGLADFPGTANILRAFIGLADSDKSGAQQLELVDVLRSNIDDASGELLGELWQSAFALGALDLSYSPLQMKKGRPGWALEMIVPPGTAAEFAQLIFAHTPTIGIRLHQEQRLILPRQLRQIDTAYGKIRLKVSGNTVSPEAADIKAITAALGIPFKTVYQAAIAAYYQQYPFRKEDQ